ncbi:MAG: SPOR domain-containing protein [Gammaproteobacteria bacterium]|nr:SPOR domain-containing protein [Gammaproteobacteria bacterium]
MASPLTWVCALAVTLIAAQSGAAEDPFQQGLNAYLAGDYTEARRRWEPLADAGDTVAAFNIGILYAQGLGVAKDPAAAFRWYQKAADAGYAPAQFNLGAAYREGAGVDVDMSQAVHWWSESAAHGHPQATFNLATLYFHGNGVARDHDKAQGLYQKAAELGDPRAQEILAKLRDANPPRADEKPADETPTAAPAPTAKSPPPAAVKPQVDESVAGAAPAPRVPSVKSPPPAAAKPQVDESVGAAAPAASETRTGAETGVKNGDWVSAQSSENLTIQLFAFGDEQAAVKFIRDNELEEQAAYFQASSGGRVWYKTVYGVYTDMASARAARDQLPANLKANSPWIRKFSAIHGEMKVKPKTKDNVSRSTDPKPRSKLATHRIPAKNLKARAKGQSAFNGQDYDLAMRVWKPLAEKGDAEAQYSLGFMYESGWGTKKDYQQAYDWYSKAADQGHSKAQYNLGLLYFRGLGVDQDKGLAYYWIQNAADQRHARAREFLLDRD